MQVHSLILQELEHLQQPPKNSRGSIQSQRHCPGQTVSQFASPIKGRTHLHFLRTNSCGPEVTQRKTQTLFSISASPPIMGNPSLSQRSIFVLLPSPRTSLPSTGCLENSSSGFKTHFKKTLYAVVPGRLRESPRTTSVLPSCQSRPQAHLGLSLLRDTLRTWLSSTS